MHEAEVYDRAINVRILRLRLKIEVYAANPKLIITERGASYRLASEVETLYRPSSVLNPWPLPVQVKRRAT
ncbi:winged helix-turn-helix domain-containing protein [Polaromonas sp.]|uniref:winged helix-turn-helix domain-containing protein n=1 Tax=Polaromonas sp. TaxID=1869339 RepID=UPI0025DA115D|nr:winged helix-turn-helix domain-containing protein [Polaromonas sp.]